MSRKVVVGVLAVFFSLGLFSMAFAGDPDRVSESFTFDSGMSGHSMSMTATDNSAAQDNRASADIDSQQGEMRGQGSAPCAVVIAKAASITEAGDCRSEYRDQYGG
jgi:hypothetical protein